MSVKNSLVEWEYGFMCSNLTTSSELWFYFQFGGLVFSSSIMASVYW